VILTNLTFTQPQFKFPKYDFKYKRKQGWEFNWSKS